MKYQIKLRLLPFVCLMVMSFVFSNTAHADFIRTIVDNGSCAPFVSLKITPNESVKAYNVEETLPDGLIPSNINENGYWDSSKHKIRWGTFLDGNSRTFTYKVTAPKGNYSVTGKASFDGKNEDITGDVKATIKYTPYVSMERTIADNQTCSPSVSLEITPYETVKSYNVEEMLPVGLMALNISENGRWDAVNRKVKWGTFPDGNIRTLTYQVSGNNGVYSVSGKASFDGHTGSITGDTEAAIECIPYVMLERTITNNQTCAPLVSVEVKPTNSVSAYNVEDILPEGLTPSNISDNGHWDALNRKLKWGTFLDSNSRTLIYSVRGQNDTYEINGKASFDGRIETITGGNTQTIIECVPVTVTISGRVAITIGGYTNLPLSQATLSLEGTDYKDINITDGNFSQLVTVPQGVYNLVITSPELTPFKKEIILTQAIGDELQLGSLFMSCSGSDVKIDLPTVIYYLQVLSGIN